MKNINETYCTLKQGRLPIFISESLPINDSVLAFDKIMEEINIKQYLKPSCKEFIVVWRKGTEKSRFRLFEKITKLIEEINEELQIFN